MRYDADLLQGVEQGIVPPTLRFFRFKEPTVSFGRLQKREQIFPLAPAGWALVQRPTGGGLVFHEQDLCLSLTWPKGQAPLPSKPQDQYRWIHTVLMEALGSPDIRMAACCDVAPAKDPFPTRQCFTNPVGFDLLKESEKIVGGALCCRRQGTLYQGSLRLKVSQALEERLQTVFEKRLR